jgi:hypothetical protein
MGIIVTALSGKAGGMVAAHNRYGYYFRNGVIPVNPKSTRQEAARALVQEATNNWNTKLTASQREAWNLYAQNTPIQGRDGKPVTITGFNHYVRSWCVTGQVAPNFESNAAPSIYQLAEVDPSVAVVISVATQQISLAFDIGKDWRHEDNSFLALWMGQPQTTQINFFNGPWRYAGKVLGSQGTPPTSPQVIAVPFPVALGQKVWCQLRVRRADNRVSNVFRTAPVTVTT